MINVPEQFRPKIRVEYPKNNFQIFEEWFYKDYLYNVTQETEREYLPIMWTGFYVNNNYGNDKKAIRELQIFIDSLDKSKKYFTIIQYDDGILNDLSKIDCYVFGMGGGHYDYPLPLTAMPHPYSFTVQRDVFCNFMGALTHPIRREVLSIAKRSGYLCSTSSLPIETYCMNLARSVFTLAPRGYGPTSFRLMEAIQYGSIPVYISDKPMIPHNKGFDYGVLIEPKDVPNIDKILKKLTPEEIEYKQMLLPKVYESLFTYEACKKHVLDNL